MDVLDSHRGKARACALQDSVLELLLHLDTDLAIELHGGDTEVLLAYLVPLPVSAVARQVLAAARHLRRAVIARMSSSVLQPLKLSYGLSKCMNMLASSVGS